MELVNHFNSELQSLYDTKPPISKGKMTSVTKAALKAVKLYKHVVQSVEKFIQKCKPEYKIPGLYVIDSIIRQSRHQFGPEKDIFAPRFSRNLQTTFAHIFKCPDEEKPKIIRVLNLWQKNKIFTPEVIQPLFDLADPNNPIWESIQKQQEAQASINNSASVSGNGNPAQAPLPPLLSDQIQFKKELLDYDYEEDDTDERNKGQQQQQPPVSTSSNNDFTANSLPGNFDALGSILANPEVLRQLQTLQEQMAAAAAAQHQQQQQLMLTPEQERQRKLAELNKQEAAFDQRLAQTVNSNNLPFATDFQPDGQNQSPNNENANYMQHGGIDQNSNQLSNHQSHLLPPPFLQQLSQIQEQQKLFSQQSSNDNSFQNPFGIPLSLFQGVPPAFSQHKQDQNSQNFGAFNQQGQENNPFEQYQPPASLFDQNMEDEKERDRRDRRRRRSRSPGRRSPARNKRRSRSNSRNRSRKRYRSRSRSRDRREREKERERLRKGFPPSQREHLSVCSTTLWVGHLSRQVSQEEISDTFGPYGDVVSIDLIAPRGCAFVVMNRRQDASRALDRLKNTKLQGKTITLAWAPGKGVKGRDWKDYWEVEAGVSYIPWNKLSDETDLEEFEDGGCVDEDTLPDYLKNKPKIPKAATDKAASGSAAQDESGSKTGVSETESNSTDANASAPEQGKPGENDKQGQKDLTPLSNQNQASMVPPPMMASPFGLPTSVGLGMMAPPMGLNTLNMMMPPPLLGPMGVPMGGPQFPPMGFPMMGNLMQPPGLNSGMPQSDPHQNQIKAGLLGEMPMTSLQQMNHNPAASSAGITSGPSSNLVGGEDDQEMKDDHRKRQPEKRENRDRKRSRFDEPEDRSSPPMDMDEGNSPSMNDRPLFERLKTLAEGYQFGGSDNISNSLLGAPIGPALRPGINPRGFPRGGGQFSGPRQPWMDNREGPRPWFDNSQSQNPFINPNPEQNPFAGGNPFVQPSNSNENPFEIAASGGGPGPGPGRPDAFFGPNARGRGGWPRDGGGAPWRGDRGRGGRGGMRGSSRDTGNWQHRRMDDEIHNSERGFDRGFRGRGRGRGRGGDFDRGRRRDWSDRDDNNREWSDRDGRDDRDGSRGERKISNSNDNYPLPTSNFVDENWEEEITDNRNTDNSSFQRKNSSENNSINNFVNTMEENWDVPQAETDVIKFQGSPIKDDVPVARDENWDDNRPNYSAEAENQPKESENWGHNNNHNTNDDITDTNYEESENPTTKAYTNNNNDNENAFNNSGSGESEYDHQRQEQQSNDNNNYTNTNNEVEEEEDVSSWNNNNNHHHRPHHNDNEEEEEQQQQQNNQQFDDNDIDDDNNEQVNNSFNEEVVDDENIDYSSNKQQLHQQQNCVAQEQPSEFENPNCTSPPTIVNSELLLEEGNNIATEN